MIRVVSCLIAALLLFGMSNPAEAQLEPEAGTGSRIRQSPEAIASDTLRRMHKDFARCIYSRKQEAADAWLRNSDFTTVATDRLPFEMDDIFRAMSLEPCIEKAMTVEQRKVSITFAQHMLRPLLAEEAYLALHDRPLPVRDSDPEILANRLIVDPNSRALAISHFADCLVFTDAVSTDAILRTRPTSAEEMRAIQRLVPTISKCIPEGEKVELTPRSVRSFAAEGLWARSYYGSITVAEGGSMHGE
ncbi:MAG: hypothetical protein DI637_11350 [Citromicrobium sp.]|nr:MAG: hypothetical protein DI637_11350 [Citromicrobium sp.]